MISPKLIPAILLAIAALRGQAMMEPSDIVSTHSDGCNTTTCYKSGLCSSTAVYCMASIVPGGVSYGPQVLAKAAPTTICGRDDRNPTANVDLVQVSCVDFDRLRAQAPDFPWPTGRVTQVLVHIREGDVVRVTVDGVVKFAPIVADPAFNRRLALVQFDGTDYKAVAVKVYRAVPE